ncbi:MULTISPECIES: 50S ribosomal protein L15 [Weeksella]|uniref:Large ribosomal subunit protein uL15 n=1 Tax=Weeksella virosa (strain ATCC 43766 / DSM 16922 / JCM 21250 / CCUG 30538 / CDC 9751 / IAM 14551 / NBRC 16016 / NCTC 11634 / CL345/78) TaxID=865938 RepID=F0NYA1_WEEVC|nr:MULTISPECIES: 50S ribosomal protein L15 [Weeksella]ADX68098.1 ribosomal protein L15 [Weeksella virosa DSM 16922]MDK7374919.1 50S ribosomal protein L15 [Weeksella virosa]MDK7675438.1 50S ribosomal protein L15 [Weeksella virosa]OFM83887.1 50S ribosomal protein L15 [Weeksella sp. HMSC059D05]SUP54409.1 50S ribosomal protein L15 [Weeksella virosa]
MNLSNLKPAPGSTKNKFRKGRGEGSGNGLTAGRGHKGAKSRSGYSKKIGFEGGQMPLQRRLPKFGFKNINRVEYQGINLDTIQALVDEKKITDTLNREVMLELGLIHKNDLVKILGRGELTAKLNITADKFTKTAQEAIEKAGGKAELINEK